MLSDSLRIMRHEFQNAVLEAGECVQISVGNMQAFIMALEHYEGAAKEMEVALWPQPMAITHTQNVQHIPQTAHHKISRLTVIQGGIST